MKKNKIFTIMAAAMTFAACSTNDITSDFSYDDASNTVTIASATRSTDDTNNTTPTTTPMTESFFLTNVTQKKKIEKRYEAVFEFNQTNNTWSPKNNAKVMWCGSGDNVFQATYPSDTNSKNGQYRIDFNKFMIPGYQYDNNDSIPDWMRAKAIEKRTLDENGKVKPLNLNFEHMLSKVTLVCDYKDKTYEGESISSVIVSKIFTRVQYCEAVTDNDGNVTIEPYQPSKYNTDGLFVWTTYTKDDTNKKASTTAIVAPGAYTTIAKVTINFGSQSEEIIINVPNGITLEAGKHYTFTLNTYTSHSPASISSVAVTDWETTTISSTTPAEKEIPYVTFSAEQEQGFQIKAYEGYTISGLQYSIGDGNWIDIPSTGMNEHVLFGGSNGNLRLRGKNLKGTAESSEQTSQINFSRSGIKVTCSGDIRTLLDYENYKDVDTSNAKFCFLFRNCTELISAPELPATDLSDYCYNQMFSGCENLTTAPSLPATTMKEYCYLGMFYLCTSLTTAPELRATTLAKGCCKQMFYQCTSLTTGPELKATKLEQSCYEYMFLECKKLSSVTMLATEIHDNQSSELYKWLENAGTSATSRTLKLNSGTEYDAIQSYLPDNWKDGASGLTIEYATQSTKP